MAKSEKQKASLTRFFPISLSLETKLIKNAVPYWCVCISIHPMYTPITNPSWLNLGNWKVMRLLLYVPFLLSSLLLLLYHPAADCRYRVLLCSTLLLAAYNPSN